MSLFLKTLQHLRGGQTISELDHQLHDAIAVVKHTGKKGIVTLKLEIVPNDAVVRTVRINDDVVSKLPTIAKASTVFFPTEENDLSVDDPLQRKLELRSVEPEARQPLRAVEEEDRQPLRDAG